jgi:signal peptidase II
MEDGAVPAAGPARAKAGAGGTATQDGVEVAEADEPPVQARGLALALLATAVVVAVGLDLLTKQLALTHLSDGSTARILGGAIYFDLTRNSGAAFSFGSDYTFIFPIIATVVLVGIVVLARRLRSVPWAIALGLIFGGAMGNLLDRMFRAPGPLHGHVVDFISAFAPAGRYFPIFNVADSALFCGVVLAIILEFTGHRRDGTRVRHSDRADG